jgi:hypothetical protein
MSDDEETKDRLMMGAIEQKMNGAKGTIDGLVRLQEIALKANCTLEELLEDVLTAGEHIEWTKRLQWEEDEVQKQKIAFAILEIVEARL